MAKKYCIDCFTQLKKDEIALSKKLLGRDIDNLFCINCLADYLSCSVEDLIIKIQEFKEQGCSLFF